MIIGLSGFARAGKDEVAKHLVGEHGFTKIAYADKLRDFLYDVNPIVGDAFDGDWVKVPTPIRLQTVIDDYGWQGYKETEFVDELRGLIQRTGTEGGRKHLGENVWVKATLKDLDPAKDYVVSDARFINEFDAITRRGGDIIRIERPGIGPANDHASEMEALQYKFKHVIHNDGDFDDLAWETNMALADIRGE